MKKSVKIILGIISAAMAVVCVMCILYIVQYVRGNSLNDKLANDIASDMTVAVPKAHTAGPEDCRAGRRTAAGRSGCGAEEKIPQHKFRCAYGTESGHLRMDRYAGQHNQLCRGAERG